MKLLQTAIFSISNVRNVSVTFYEMILLHINFSLPKTAREGFTKVLAIMGQF